MYNAIFFTDTSSDFFSTVPMGAYKCANALRKAGYSCLVVNNTSKYSFEELEDLLARTVSEDTLFIGSSLTFVNFDQFTSGVSPFLSPNKKLEDHLVIYARGINPRIKFAVGGGNSVTNQYNNKNVDYAFIGYSEAAVVNFAKHLSTGCPLPGSYKNIFGITIVDHQDDPLYEFCNDQMLWEPADVVNYKALPLEISRGCIFNCKFCSFPLRGKKSKDFVRSEESLYNELNDNYKKYGITSYYIVDDTFNDHVEKLETMLAVVERLEFKPVFWAYLRLDLICTRPQTLDMLVKIGVRAMFFGIETLNPHAAKSVGKGHSIPDQIRMIRHIKETYTNVYLHGSFIIGLPGDTVDTQVSSLDRLISGDIPLDSWKFKPLSITKVGARHPHNSDLELDYKKFGYEMMRESLDDVVVWKSDTFDLELAIKLSTLIVNKTEKFSKCKLTGQQAITLASVGIDFDVAANTLVSDFKFRKFLETNLKPSFMAQYKKQLLELIEKK